MNQEENTVSKDKYHIVYKEYAENFYSKGKTIEAESPEQAFELWKKEFPNTYFMALYRMNTH